MIDGYVSGATVFCDANGNGELDAGEVSTTTNAVGGYSLTGGCDATVIGHGGFNVDTGFAFNGKLATPKGSTVITPLTTMVATSPLTMEQFAESLSLLPGTDITQINIADGQHQGLLKTTLAVHQIIDGIVRIVASKGGGTDVKAVYGRVAKGFGNTLAQQPRGTIQISPSGDFNSSLASALVKSLPDVQALGITAADFDAAINALIADAQTFAKASDAELLGLTRSLQNPANAPVNTSATSSYLNLVDESVSFNGAKVSLADLKAGATITGLTTLGFNLSVTGAPAADVTTSLALELVEQVPVGVGRKLQLLIDQVQLKLNQANQLSVLIPAGAKVYAYGRAGNGTEINLTLADLSFKPITVTGNGFSLNYSNMVNKVLASVSNTTATTAEKFVNIKGTFTVKVVMAKVNLRHSDATAFTNQVITVTNTPQSVTGAGFSGTLIVN